MSMSTDISTEDFSLAKALPISSAAADEAPADVITRRIDRPIEGGTDEEMVRRATKEWEQGLGGDDPFIEQRNAVVERTYDGRDHGTKTLQEATTDLSNAHFEELPDTRFAAEVGNTTPAQMREAVKNPDVVRSLRPDWNEAEISHYVKTGEPPPNKVGLVDHKGALVEALRDSEPIRPDQALNAREAAKQLKSFRQADAAYRQQFAEQMQAAAQAQAQPEEPAPSPPPPPSQDAQLAQQRAQLEAQQRWVQQTAAIQQLSADERSCQHELAQISQFLNSYYTPSELRSGQAVGDERNAWLHEAVNRAEGLQRVAANAAELRQAKQASMALVQQAQATRWAEAEDAKFNEWLANKYPQYATGAGRSQLIAAARDTASPGFAQSYNQFGPARSFEGQRDRAEAAMWHIAQTRARDLNSKRAYTPPVQPGAYASRASHGEQSIQDLERKVANASTVQQQLRWSAKLTAARRSAGLLRNE